VPSSAYNSTNKIHHGTFLTSIRDDCPGSFPQSRAYTKTQKFIINIPLEHTNNEGYQIRKREEGLEMIVDATLTIVQ
jgi:hypothetical protein